MYYVYMLKLSGKKSVYIGFTADLDRRLSEHKRGIVRSTRKNFEKLLYSEQFAIKADAMHREKWLKSGVGREWLHKEFKV